MDIVPPSENSIESTASSGPSAEVMTEPTATTETAPVPLDAAPAATVIKPRPPTPPGPALKVHDGCLLESVGFGFDDDFFFTMIHAGAGLTTFGGRVFSTSADWQTELTLPVHAGTNSHASRNRRLGTCIISGVPAGPRGKARVEIRFTASEDGTLAIAAHAKESGRELAVELRQDEAA